MWMLHSAHTKTTGKGFEALLEQDPAGSANDASQLAERKRWTKNHRHLEAKHQHALILQGLANVLNVIPKALQALN